MINLETIFDKLSTGETLNPQEDDYFVRIKRCFARTHHFDGRKVIGQSPNGNPIFEIQTKKKTLIESLVEHFDKLGKSRREFETYLIHDKSCDLFKIGRAKNVQSRLNQIKSHNANVELVWSYKEDIERALHVRFHEKRVHREWFQLSSKEVNEITNI